MGNGRQDERYLAAAAEYRSAFERLARAYEADPDKRKDDLHVVHGATSSISGTCWRDIMPSSP
jgi:hypothetical protein